MTEQSDPDSRQASLPIGAEVLPKGGVRFRVWAPQRSSVSVIIEYNHFNKPHDITHPFALTADNRGYFSGIIAEAGPGTRYCYQLDGEGLFPDPASRYQPEGAHGPSQVIDPRSFAWSDDQWRGIELAGQVFYEMHVGTFTAEGTWKAAIQQLPRLKELGITCLEVMPVAGFPGSFGWGYDGVNLFAPTHLYGTPDEFREFVDKAHALGLGVILDVVYNHLGPEGAYHRDFARDYFHSLRDKNEWGEALNFDGENCKPVREFFVANAGYWIKEFHLDGLRLDAVQAIHDESPDHILAEISRHTRQKAEGRSILLIAEDEFQDTTHVRPLEQGGHGLDALWNDDFHHSMRVALTGRSEGYYGDYQGSPQELISVQKWGYLFQGQYSKWKGKARGTPTTGLPGSTFVTFLENHDQLANSAQGARLRTLTSFAQYKAITALWLLGPGTPMFFQGQEFGASTPFLYFADLSTDLAPLVAQGRRESLARFESIAHPDLQAILANPTARESFLISKLAPDKEIQGSEFLSLHRDLLQLRRDDPIFHSQRAEQLHGAVITPEAFVLRYFTETDDCRLLLVNLGPDLFPVPTSEPLMAPPRGCHWDVLWYSEHPRYGGCGAPVLGKDEIWRIPARSTTVLQPVPCRDSQTLST